MIMIEEHFFVLMKNEVQDFANEIIGRDLTEVEYQRVRSMFEHGIEHLE
jgi:hypothetical protein